ncbi:MAG: hypothetical protein DRP76_00815 [Candidatus Omnitrophota bacterium]|nr:MAG: hypothetical protein DRP76_00815 [Candidatus Omnitrophota bacterium]
MIIPHSGLGEQEKGGSDVAQRKAISAVIGLSFALAQVSLAEEAKKEVTKAYKLGEVVVTATKTEREIGEVPASISVVGSEGIEKTAITALDDTFRYTPDFQVIRGEGMGTVHNFMSIRGIGYGRNLIYVDGVNMVESYRGTTTLSFLPTKNVEKVEILRGPSSALYGGRAMGGVINVFTKMPEKGWRVWFQPEYGAYDYQHYPLSISYGGENFGISLVYSYKSIKNYWTRKEIVGRDYDYRTGTYTYYDTTAEQGHDGWENWNRDYDELPLRTKLDLKLWDTTKLSLSIGYMENETGNGYTDRYQNVKGVSNVEKNLEKTKLFVGLIGETKFTDGTILSYRASFHNPEAKNYSENMDLTIPLEDQPLGGTIWNPKPIFYRSIGENGSRDYELELRLSKLFFEVHRLTLGTEYIRNEIYEEIKQEGTNKDLTHPMDEDLNAFSVYVQDEWQVIEPLLLTVGVRGDFYSDFDNQVSPKVSFLYDLTENTKIFGSFATAYNPPPYYQVFCPDWNMTAYIIRIKNPDLEPEKSIGWELGMRHKFFENFHAGVTGFWTEARDLIESVSEKRQVGQTTAAGEKCYMTYEHHENLDKARMAGIEVESELKLGKNHKFFANYTFLDAIDKETGERLERRPKHMASFGYSFNWKPNEKFSYWVSIRARAMDEIWVKEWGTNNKLWVSGFGVVDLSIGINILNHGQVFFNAKNLFDKTYKEFTYSRYQPGRLIWGGVKFYF